MQIVPYQSSLHKEGTLRLLGNGAYKREIIDWQFSQNRNFGPIVATDDKGQVIGFNGIMPVTLYVNDGLVRAAWSCDFIVSPDCRRKGVGQQLKSALNEQWPVIMAMGISQVGQKALQKAGWSKLRGPHRFRLRGKRTDEPYSAIEPNRSSLRAVSESVSKRYQYQITLAGRSHFPDDNAIDSILAEVIAEYPTCVYRNSEYFSWRYRDCPDTSYISLLLEQGGTTLGIGILQITHESVSIVDYLGPRYGSQLKEAIVDAAIELAATTDHVECTTNDPEFQNCLRSRNFQSTRWSSVPFYIRNRPDEHGPVLDNWFLMGGDSDGQILAGARSTWGKLFAQTLEENEVCLLGGEWDRLLLKAGADPLFLSRTWQTKWWAHFANHHQLKLHFTAVRDVRGELVALFPFYQHKTRSLGITSNRLEPIGNVWQGPATMRSEYLEPVIDPEWIAPASELLANSISGMPALDDFVLTDFPLDSTRSWHVASALQQIGYARKSSPDPRDEARFVLLPGSFSDYVSALSRSTRLRVFGRRKRLNSLGNVQYITLETNDLEDFFRTLNDFHRSRWGSPVFENERLDFHLDIASTLAAEGRLRATKLTLNGDTLSVSYNLSAGDRVYNLQLGFDQTFGRGKLSLGLLHLGYDIEQAILDGYREFDLLAGSGRASLYKDSITNCGAQLSTIHIVRSRWRRLIYMARDRFIVDSA